MSDSSEFYRFEQQCFHCKKRIIGRFTQEDYPGRVGPLRIGVQHADGTPECIVIKSPAINNPTSDGQELRKMIPADLPWKEDGDE